MLRPGLRPGSMPQQWSSLATSQELFQFVSQRSSFELKQDPFPNDFSIPEYEIQTDSSSPELSINDLLLDLDDIIEFPPECPQTQQMRASHLVGGCFSNSAERDDARLENAGNRVSGHQCYPQRRPSLTAPTSDLFQVNASRVDTLHERSAYQQTGFAPGAYFALPSSPRFYDASAAENYLRMALGIPRDKPVSLLSILDPPNGEKPSIPLRLLIGLAIYDSDQKSLTLQGIYDALSDRFKYFRVQDDLGIQSWRKSVRHALSLYSVFTKIERRKGDPGKGCYWMLDVAAASVEGQYTRPRKRKNKGNGKDKETGTKSSKLGSRPSKGKPRYSEASRDFHNGSNASVTQLNEGSFAQAFEESYSQFQALMASDTSAVGWPPAPRTDLAF